MRIPITSGDLHTITGGYTGDLDPTLARAGDVLAFSSSRIAFPSTRSGSRNLFSKLADGTGAEEQITHEKLLANVGSISPDGKLAFVQLNPSGENDIAIIELQGERKTTVLRAFPGPEDKWQISSEGGVAPMWARNGRELFYGSSPESSWRWTFERSRRFRLVLPMRFWSEDSS